MNRQEFRVTLGTSKEATALPARAERRVARAAPPKPSVSAGEALRALKANAGSAEILKKVPGLNSPNSWRQVAYFSVCQKTGTAAFLDIWDADHFDGFTDLQRELTDCRVWFSDQGFTYWNSGQTHTGRINCYFRAPANANYVCNVQLQSYGGLAKVECIIDAYSFGQLGFNGTIVQPHPAVLSAGYHSFRINQVSGAYFFVNLTVFQV